MKNNEDNESPSESDSEQNDQLKLYTIETLKDVSYMLSQSLEKCDAFSKKLKKSDNPKNTENVSVGLVNLFTKLMKNVSLMTSNLDMKVKELNKDRSHEMFLDLTKKIDEVKEIEIPLIESMLNIKKLSETDGGDKVENIPDCTEETKQEPSENRSKISLSLKRRDSEVTQDTSDGLWISDVDRALAIFQDTNLKGADCDVEEFLANIKEDEECLIKQEVENKVIEEELNDIWERETIVQDSPNKLDCDDINSSQNLSNKGSSEENTDCENEDVPCVEESSKPNFNDVITSSIVTACEWKDENSNCSTICGTSSAFFDDTININTAKLHNEVEVDEGGNSVINENILNKTTELNVDEEDKQNQDAYSVLTQKIDIFNTLSPENILPMDSCKNDLKSMEQRVETEPSTQPNEVENDYPESTSSEDLLELLKEVHGSNEDTFGNVSKSSLAVEPTIAILNDMNKMIDENTSKLSSSGSSTCETDLLEVLKEVDVSEDEQLENISEPAAKRTQKDAMEVFKRFMDTNTFVSSDTDDDSELHSSDFLFSDQDDDNDEKNDDLIENDLLQQHTEGVSAEASIQDTVDVIQTESKNKTDQFKECSIELIDYLQHNYTYEGENSVRGRMRRSDSVERLCDINSLLKRRCESPVHQEKSVKRRKRVRKLCDQRSDLQSDILSDFSESSFSGDLLEHNKTASPLPDIPKMGENPNQNELLAAAICDKNYADSSDSDVSTDISNSAITENRKKKFMPACKNGEKQKLTEDEKRRKSWRHDPLLRGALSSDSSDSSSFISVTPPKKKINLKTKYENDDDDFNMDSNSSSDCNIVKSDLPDSSCKSNKTITKLTTPTADNECSDNTTDSDIGYNKKTIFISDEDEDESTSKQGRRNIRALMLEEHLEETTKKANEEEKQRILRISRIKKIRETQSQSSITYETDDTLILDSEEPVTVHPILNKRLKPHQKEGVLFMWLSCYESVERLKTNSGSGCILAHCMGLGKTFQVITLIHTLFTHSVTNTKHVLVVCPLSVVSNWKNEFRIAFNDLPRNPINIHTIADKKESTRRFDIVKRWHKKGGVLILGYESFEAITKLNKHKKMSDGLKDILYKALIDPGPNLVICDEGHLLRNKAASRTIALNKIKTTRRIALTGTPLQNNLNEYYQMVQFVKPNLLGTLQEFRTNFINPIVNGQYDDSTPQDIKLMKRRTHVLHQILNETVQRYEVAELEKYLPKIIDYAIFIELHSIQTRMYEKYIEIVTSTDWSNKKGFFHDYRIIKQICSHPYIFHILKNRKNVPKRKSLPNEEISDDEVSDIHLEGWWKTMMPVDVHEKIEYGNKFYIMKSIIEEAEQIGDKVLIFSQSLAEMDCIEYFMKTFGTSNCPSWRPKIDYYRMDGTVPPEDRSMMCDAFNHNDNRQLRLFIMSHRVGGLGLNLIAANRVILMGVNFNPSHDTQSVFRAYRMGQTKACFIYRLISLGTMEEKNYQRCVTKLAIASRVVDKHQITRHYKSLQLREMYTYNWSTEGASALKVPEDKLLAMILIKTACIYKYHEHQDLLKNRPDESLNEHEKIAAWEEFIKMNEPPPPPLPPPVTSAELTSNLPNSVFLQAPPPPPNKQFMPKDTSYEDFMVNEPLANQRDPLAIPLPNGNNNENSSANCVRLLRPFNLNKSVKRSKQPNTKPGLVDVHLDDDNDDGVGVYAHDNVNGRLELPRPFLIKKVHNVFNNLKYPPSTPIDECNNGNGDDDVIMDESYVQDSDDMSVDGDILNREIIKNLQCKGVTVSKWPAKSFDGNDIITLD